jgi:hypothetical protein
MSSYQNVKTVVIKRHLQLLCYLKKIELYVLRFRQWAMVVQRMILKCHKLYNGHKGGSSFKANNIKHLLMMTKLILAIASKKVWDVQGVLPSTPSRTPSNFQPRILPHSSVRSAVVLAARRRLAGWIYSLMRDHTRSCTGGARGWLVLSTQSIGVITDLILLVGF